MPQPILDPPGFRDPSSAAARYLDTVRRQIDEAVGTQSAALETAAQRVAQALAADRFLYAFGTGHSHMLAEEIFYRAGGLARAAAILDPPLMLHQGAAASSHQEQQSGYAASLLDRYPVAAGDVLVIASNSGRNAVPVEMALIARERGLCTIAITSLQHSRAFPSRHPSGKRLFEIAEIVLDNQAVAGDAAIDLPGLPRRIGPTSSIAGILLLNLTVVRAVELLVNQGVIPEVYASSNADVPGWNDQLIARYQSRLRHL
ncbi:MAG: SIS domain-containing protein [Verrucomicrobiales bacterium]|nr:SIS domain-containing protein [Verrucomicrobiales bacterium]